MVGTLASSLGAALSARFYQRPIFQVGASRSGTIVLYKALGTHPAIFSMPSEDPFVSHIAAAVAAFEFGEDAAYFEESVRIKKPYLYRELRRLCFESAAGPHRGWKTLLKGVIDARREFLRKTYWCVKCFPIERHARALLHLYPEARFLYIVRSGIDVVQSRTKFPAFRDQPFDAHCRFWVQAAEKFSYLTNFDRAVQIQQEELLAAPEAAFARIAAHLGLDDHPNPANYVKTTLVHSLGDKATHKNVDVQKSLTERAPGHATWTDEQRDAFKRICGPAMQVLGYTLPF